MSSFDANTKGVMLLFGGMRRKITTRCMYVNEMDKKVHDQRGNAKLEDVSSKMILMRPEGGSIISTRGRMYKLLMESRIEGKK